MKPENLNEAETSRTAEAQPRCAPADGSELLPMKRFLAFKGSIYYPCGGMDDFFRDFDALDEAISGVIEHAQTENVHDLTDLWRFSWAHVYDAQERRIVWTDANVPNDPSSATGAGEDSKCK